jgi:hypothetical protein
VDQRPVVANSKMKRPLKASGLLDSWGTANFSELSFFGISEKWKRRRRCFKVKPKTDRFTVWQIRWPLCWSSLVPFKVAQKLPVWSTSARHYENNCPLPLVHMYSSDSVEITNKMQPCIRIYYSTLHWRLNMFRAAYRSSSGALTVFAASGLYTHVVTGRS